LTDAEIAAILDEAQGEWKGLIVIGLHTGLRLGDACRLDWSAFKADGTVEVVTGKTGALVKLPSAGLLEALERSNIVRPSNLQGEVLPEIAAIYKRDPGEVSKRVERMFRRAGLKTREMREGWSRARPDASFHSLRHTFVTRAIEAGVPAAIVRALVGHATAAMTDRYSHVSGEAVAAAFEEAGL
jgi:integrase